MVITKTHHDKKVITLTPNRSASMRQTKILIYAVTGFVLLIGIGWSLMGAYLILPFAGLEVGLFAYFMHKICRSTYNKQIITIKKDRIICHSGIHAIEHTKTLERPAAYVEITEPEHPTEPVALCLTDSKSRFEVGGFLNQADRVTTREAFNKAGLMEFSSKWWVSKP